MKKPAAGVAVKRVKVVTGVCCGFDCGGHSGVALSWRSFPIGIVQNP